MTKQNAKRQVYFLQYVLLLALMFALFVVITNIYANAQHQDPKLYKKNNGEIASASAASPTEVLVKFKKPVRDKVKNNPKDTGIKSVDEKLKKYPVVGFEQIAKKGNKSKTDAEVFGWYKIALDPNQPIVQSATDEEVRYPLLEELQADLESDPSVDVTQMNYYVNLDAIPNDPYYSTTGLWSQSYDDLWGLKKVNAAAAWDTTTGSSAVVVAVIDTGLDVNHPDISANVWTNPGEIPNNSIDEDGNGFVDDYYGWNFYSNSRVIDDDHGHGTHVAGTVAAVGNNGIGVSGMSWSTKLMPIKIFNSTGSATTSGIAAGLQYAADMGADISSNSYTCRCTTEQLYTDAINYEYERNVVPVVAAGNYASDTLDYMPASVDGAIAVAATDVNDAIASFSNRGNRIDVSAPGVDILSLKAANATTTCVGGQIVATNYCHISGTSMATPLVSGLASLLLAHNSSLNIEQIRQILRTTAVDIGAVGRDNIFGNGRVDASAAMGASTVPQVLTPRITFPKTRDVVRGFIDITGTVDGTNLQSYKIEAGQGRAPSTWVTVLDTTATPITNGVLKNFDTSTLPDGTYIFRLTATSTQGKSYEYSVYDVYVNGFDAKLYNPQNIISKGQITINGSAGVLSGLSFDNFILEYGVGSSPSSYSSAGISLVSGGNVPITNNVLGTWDTSSLIDGQAYTLRLTVRATNGALTQLTSLVYVDQKLVPGWPKYIPNTSCPTFCNSAGAVFADLNGDGSKEVVIPAATNEIHAFNKDGSVYPGFPVIVTPGDYFKHQPIVADLDGDLLPEIFLDAIVGTSGTHRIYIVKGNGQQYPGWPKPVYTYPSGGDLTPTIADLNNDGTKEIITMVINGNTTLHAYNLTGTELPGFPKSLAIQLPWIGMPVSVSDVNNDGLQDIVYASYNKVYILSNTGVVVRSIVLPDNGVDDETIQGSVSIGDVNGDGQKEILVTGQKNGALGAAFRAYAYSYNGTLLPGWPVTAGNTTNTVGVPLNIIANADIDNDGKDEVMTGQHGGAIIDDGTGKRATAFFMGQGQLSIADFAGDGNVKFPGSYNHGFQWGNNDFSVYWKNDNMNTLSYNRATPNAFIVSDLDNNGSQEFFGTAFKNDETYYYLWDIPGTTNPKDEWPMHTHDAARTSHYTVGQIVSDTTAPQVTITSPTSGSTVSGNVTLQANAIDSEGTISKVEFYVDGVFIDEDTSFPYSITWNTVAASVGSHTVTAKAFDNANNSATSIGISVNVPDTTAPSAPTNIFNGTITDNSISFSWNASTDNVGVAGYRIFRNGTQITTTTNTFYTDTSLTAETAYTYAIAAYDAAGNTSLQATTIITSAQDATAPSIPTSLSSSAITATTLRLQWSESTDNVATTGYEVYRNGVLIGTSATNSYDDSALQPLTAYSYQVKSFDARGNISALSAGYVTSTVADTVAPSTPNGLQIINNAYRSQRLVWSAANDNVGVVSYSVYRDNVLIGTTNQLYHDNSGLLPGIAYNYAVIASDAAGNQSTLSATLIASTATDTTPPIVSISNPAEGSTHIKRVTVSASASDDDVLASLTLYINGTQTAQTTTNSISYTWDTLQFANNTHQIKAVAIDDSGNVTEQTITVMVANGRRGDVNGDNKVNILDLSALLSNWQTTNTNADLDGSGVVNIFDLSILLYEYGK